MKTSKITSFKQNTNIKVLTTKQTLSVKGGASGKPEEVAPLNMEIALIMAH